MANEYHSAFGVLGLTHDMRLRTYESCVRERLAGHTLTTALEAHLLLGGRPENYTREACRATTGLLLIFGYEPLENGKFYRFDCWEQDFAHADRRERRTLIERLHLGDGRNRKG